MVLAPDKIASNTETLTPDNGVNFQNPDVQHHSAADRPVAMSERPLVSVVMPVYNAASTLERAVRSVLNQTYTHWELLLVIDGSPDNSVEIAQSFTDPRVRVIVQENQGAGASRNNGVAQSHGEYLAFLDSDDIWHPDKLSAQLAVIRENGNPIAFTYCWFYSFDEKNRLTNIPPAYTDSGNIFDAVLKKEGLLIPSSTMMHRRIFEELGGYPTMSHHEDWHFSLRMTLQYPGYPTQERLLLYSQTLSGKGRARKKYYEESLRIYVHDDPYLKERVTPEVYQQFIDRQKRSLFWSFLVYNYMDNARRYYPQIAHQDICVNLKGKLAWFSIKTGINVLYYARIVYQWGLRNLTLPWWRQKTAWAFGH